MKRIIFLLIFVSFTVLNVNASIEELGNFGGVSSGKNLPKTIEKYIKKSRLKQSKYPYKEVIFLDGKPTILEGSITIKRDTSKILKSETGNYKESCEVRLKNKDGAKVLRKISFVVDYKVINSDFKKQVQADARESTIKWTESITIGGKTYKLDSDKSTFSMSEVTDITPAISYFDRTISIVAYYSDKDSEVIVTKNGSHYGYEQPWSKNETSDFSVEVTGLGEDKNIVANTKSSVTAKKEIYFDKTNPYPISFAGTYNQRLVRDATLTYDVLSGNVEKPHGTTSIKSGSSVEKLPIPAGLDFLSGHWAEDDMKKLYSMEVYTDVPHDGMQNEAITRGDYIKALVRAMNIDTNIDRKERDLVVFGDVLPDNEVYKYVMAAHRTNLVKGTGSSFEVDRPISREEAFVILIRIIGLERLGGIKGVKTPFIDDKDISFWARKEIEAGRKLGIIKGNGNGKLKPKSHFTKAEAAAIINRLIDYLRNDIGEMYRVS